jgi:hypothetical protein
MANNQSLQDVLLRLMEEGLTRTFRSTSANNGVNGNPGPRANPPSENTNHTLWQNIAQQLLNRSHTRQNNQPPLSTQQNHIVEPPPPHIHDLINNFMYDYTRNMREYNDNVRLIIHLLEQLIPSATNTVRPSVPEQSTSHTSTTSPNSTEELLFSYYIFPLTGQIPPVQTSREPLSREQIAQYTRTYGYTQNMVSLDSSENLCPITLEAFQVGDVVCEIIGCGHVFKRPPLINWFRRDGRCPSCRFELINTVLPTPETMGSTSDLTTSVPAPVPAPVPVSVPTSVPAPNPAPVPSISTAQSQIQSLLQGLLGMQDVFDTSGNEMYEFNIPLQYDFTSSFTDTTNDLNDPNTPDVD